MQGNDGFIFDFIDAFAGIQVSVTSLEEHTYEDECNKYWKFFLLQ